LIVIASVAKQSSPLAVIAKAKKYQFLEIQIFKTFSTYNFP